MKILFFGTSHISAIKSAWDNYYKEQDKISADFIATYAPAMSKQNNSGWVIDGDKILFSEPSTKRFLKISSGSENTPIRPLEYDVICFVDLFFCYDFSFRYARPNDHTITTSDGHPVSDLTYKNILKSQLGVSLYNNHPEVGNVPKNSMALLLENVLKINPSVDAYLTPRPFVTCNRFRSEFSSWSDPAQVLKLANIFDDAARSYLDSFGITYLCRDTTQICDKSGATPNCFSNGWLADGKIMDEHMNAEYGRIILNSLFSKIL